MNRAQTINNDELEKTKSKVDFVTKEKKIKINSEIYYAFKHKQNLKNAK